MRTPPRRLYTLGLGASALALVLAGASALTTTVWPRALDETSVAAVRKSRARVAALADARAGGLGGTRRFDTIVRLMRAGIGDETPEALTEALSRIEAARAEELAGADRGAEIDRAVVEMDVRLHVAAAAAEPPGWLSALSFSGILVALAALGAFVASHRGYAADRRHVAAVLGRDPHLADDGPLADAVKSALYAERLKAVHPRAAPGDVEPRTPASHAAQPAPTSADRGARSTDLPVLAVPDLVVEPPPAAASKL